jgi:hypothetical protein
MMAMIQTHAEDSGGQLRVDLVHILDALALPSLEWLILELDAMGAPQVRARADDAAVKLVPGAELHEMASGISQTIDGRFLGFPEGTTRASLTDADFSVRAFPTNRASLFVWIVDSTQIYMCAKDKAVLAPLEKLFPFPTWVDPDEFFE